MNIQQMMQQARKLQSQMEKKQAELAEMTFDATVGGGMVTVVVTGKMLVQQVKIDPSLLKAEDADMVQDMVLTATNEAIAKAQAATQNAMGGMLGGMGGLAGMLG